LAKKWFSIGEDAIKANDDVTALKAYQCSLKFVPHGFTAFNIAQVAERVGDLELAISSYNQYLLLVPDAKDADEISQKAEALKQRLARAKKQAASQKRAAAPPPVAPSPIEPSPISTEPVPAAAQQPTESVSERRSDGFDYRTWAWISYGGAAAFLVGGLVTNLLARSQMNTCNSRFNPDDPVATRPSAESACDAGAALAYTSYVLFGVGGAAAALGTFFVLRPTESSEVAMTPLPEGGLALRWGGRF
jgi:tetratricopeptide (TPR) repeat protein